MPNSVGPRVGDRRALAAAEMLKTLLSQSVETELVAYDPLKEGYRCLRSDAPGHCSNDANRDWTRDSDFRRELSGLLALPSVMWNIDIHSFPDPSDWADCAGGRARMCFLHLPESRTIEKFKTGGRLTLDIPAVLQLPVVECEGSQENSIIKEAGARGKDAILIEVLEDRELYPSRWMRADLEKIAKIVIEDIRSSRGSG